MSNKQYEFSEHSLTYRQNIEGDALRAFERFIGKCVRYLEIGVFEGGSGCWILDNILTNPLSTYTGVDDNIRQEAIHNLGLHGSDRVNLIHADSTRALPDLYTIGCRYDMIYIDGCHNVKYAVRDLENSISLLNPNGVILIDDYNHHEYKLKEPIDNYLSTENNVEVLFRTYRIGIIKK